jgi:hypothetical protein
MLHDHFCIRERSCILRIRLLVFALISAVRRGVAASRLRSHRRNLEFAEHCGEFESRAASGILIYASPAGGSNSEGRCCHCDSEAVCVGSPCMILRLEGR